MNHLTAAITAVLTVLLCMQYGGGNAAMTTIKAMSKDQIACEMCFSCENPCQPLSPPPPPVYPPPPPVPSPPPPVPSPPPPATPECPPPPPPPPSDICPPPPSQPTGGGGVITGSYYPPADGYSYPPPRPMVPYFPYYGSDSLPSATPTAAAFLCLLILVI